MTLRIYWNRSIRLANKLCKTTRCISRQSAHMFDSTLANLLISGYLMRRESRMCFMWSFHLRNKSMDFDFLDHSKYRVCLRLTQNWMFGPHKLNKPNCEDTLWRIVRPLVFNYICKHIVYTHRPETYVLAQLAHIKSEEDSYCTKST